MTGPLATAAGVSIRALGAAEAEARLGELSAILVDAVAHGASVNFLAGFSDEESRAFWRGQLPGIAAGERRLLVAEINGRLVGTVVLTFASQPNAPHRAEVGKMLVLSSTRRQGIGRSLLGAAEDAAREAGRTLLLLDTETGGAGDLLYQRCGWTEVGTVADHSFTADGRLAAATVFCKALGPHRPPRRGALKGMAMAESGHPPPPRAGHNGGPPLEDDPGASWRLWCWRRARKRAWSAPREVALGRLARAEALGMTYREYTLEILERSRHL